MIWWISAEVYQLVACVSQESYRSMHKPTVEQLFQVSLALWGLPFQPSTRVASASVVVLTSNDLRYFHTTICGTALDLAVVALEACT